MKRMPVTKNMQWRKNVRLDNPSVKREIVPGYRATFSFAVHRSNVPGHKKHWTITHIPTGCKIPGYYRTRKDAADTAHELQYIRGVNWGNPYPNGVENVTREVGERIIAVTRTRRVD